MLQNKKADDSLHEFFLDFWRLLKILLQPFCVLWCPQGVLTPSSEGSKVVKMSTDFPENWQKVIIVFASTAMTWANSVDSNSKWWKYDINVCFSTWLHTRAPLYLPQLFLEQQSKVMFMNLTIESLSGSIELCYVFYLMRRLFPFSQVLVKFDISISIQGFSSIT